MGGTIYCPICGRRNDYEYDSDEERITIIAGCRCGQALIKIEETIEGTYEN